MGYSAMLRGIVSDCNQIFISFRSEWQAIEPEWKDQQRRKFEQSEIKPLLITGGHLVSALSEVCQIIERFERQGFLN